MAKVCAGCGHPLELSHPARSLVDLLRRRPAHGECWAVDDEDFGNGMAGDSACLCRNVAHTDSIPTVGAAG